MEKVEIYSVEVGTVGVMSGQVVGYSFYTPHPGWSGPMRAHRQSPEGNPAEDFNPAVVFLSPRLEVSMLPDGYPDISWGDLRKKLRRRIEERLRKSDDFFAAVCDKTHPALTV